MASNNKLTVGELVYKISGDMENLKTELKKSEAEVTKLKDSMEKTKTTTNSFTDSMKNLAKGLGLAFLAKLAFDFGKASVQAYANAQQSLIQFNNAQQNVAGTTKEQINNLNEYILALEKKTTVDDKSIRQAAQILAQDQISIDNQKKLLAGIVDISVANSKANGGEIDTQGTATAIGRAMATGELGTLTRQNIVGIDASTASLFKLGNEAQRTAILAKLLAENGKGAGEALGNSFQGSMNRAKDTVEDLQVAIGKGLTSAFSVFANGLSDTIGGVGDMEKGTNKLGVAFVYIAGLLNFMINTFKLFGIMVLKVGVSLGEFAKITWAFGKDVLGVFQQVGKAINSISEAMVDVLTGQFKDAKEALKSGFDFSGTFDNSKKAIEEMSNSTDKLGEAFTQTSKDIGANVTTMANAGKVYQEVTEQNDKLAEAKDSLLKKQQKQTQATEEEKKAMETLRDKVFDLRQKVDDLSNSIGEKLVEASKKFVDTVKDIVTENTKTFSDIVIGAEKDIEDLRKRLADEQAKSGDQRSQSAIDSLQKEIDGKQKILTSYANFQSELNKKIEESQQKAQEAQTALLTETDPSKKANLEATVQGLNAQVEAFKGFADLTKSVDEARKLAGEDEFKQAQINAFAKIELATKTFIEETTKLKEKQAVAEEVEKSITDFYKTQTALKQKTLDTFATSSIATLRRIGSEAQSAIAALNSAMSKGAQLGISTDINPLSSTQISTPQQSTPGSTISNTNNKTVNAPITVNATIQGNTDSSQLAKDLAWSLSHK